MGKSFLKSSLFPKAHQVLVIFTIAAASAGLAFAIPDRAAHAFVSWDVGIWIYSLIIAFFIDGAMDRKGELKTNVALELNYLRHIYHTVEQLGKGKWRADMLASVSAYQKKIASGFLLREMSVEPFMRIEHLLYQYRPSDTREQTLYAEALSSIRQLALIRERITHGLGDTFSWTQWVRLGLTCLCLIVLVIMPKDTILDERIAIAFSIFVISLPMDMFARSNALSSERVGSFEKQYLRNLQHLEKYHKDSK